MVNGALWWLLVMVQKCASCWWFLLLSYSWNPSDPQPNGGHRGWGGPPMVRSLFHQVCSKHRGSIHGFPATPSAAPNIVLPSGSKIWEAKFVVQSQPRTPSRFPSAAFVGRGFPGWIEKEGYADETVIVRRGCSIDVFAFNMGWCPSNYSHY